MAANSPGAHNARRERGISGVGFGLTFVVGPHHAADGGSPDPVAGPFVRDGKSPTASMRGPARDISSVGNRSGAGDHDHPRTGAKSGCERNHRVADHFRVRRNQFQENAPDYVADVGMSGAGHANAGPRDLGGSDAGGGTSLTDGGAKRFPRPGFADANQVAARGGAAAENGILVADQAGGLAAAAVNAKEKSHSCISSIRSRYTDSSIGARRGRRLMRQVPRKRIRVFGERKPGSLTEERGKFFGSFVPGRTVGRIRAAHCMGLDKLDLTIIAIYLAGITLFGLRFRKKQRTLRDYFLADRNIPWWAIALSIVAAETSTLTIISIPGLAYDTNLLFLQVVLGYLVGRVIISFILLPHYFRGDLYTAYELIERRFGRRLRSLTAGLFLLTRAAAEGVRVYAVSIVVAIALGTGEIASIAIITALTLIYTFEGGLAAVIWTDVVQTVIYVGGTLVGAFTILHLVPGGWATIQRVAANSGKLQVFDFSFDPWKPYTFWAGLVGGAFLTTASHGTDQLIVQRLLAARNQRQSVTALLSSGVALLFQFALFLMVGVMLFVFYRQPSANFGKADRIYPTFIVNQMPHGISGLLIAAILAAAMSNLSAALNSLSSSSMIDFYLRSRPDMDEGKKIRSSRISTLLWALVLFALAVLSLHKVGRVIEVGLQIASVAYGALLGVFLLGVLTRRANQKGAMLGMLCGFLSELYIWLGTSLPWTWYVAIGTVITFGVGLGASRFLTDGPRRPA